MSAFPSYLVADWQRSSPRVAGRQAGGGLTAGASAPDVLVDDVVAALRRFGRRFRSPRYRVSRKRFSSGCRSSCLKQRSSSAGTAAGSSNLSIALHQALTVGAYVVRQHLSCRKRYPLVLMLEPLFRCNLACAGCGKIDYPDPILNQRMSVADALGAIDECGAPVVVMAGASHCCTRTCPKSCGGAIARKKFRHRLHNSAAAGKDARSVPAEPLFQLVGAPGRRSRHARQVGLPDGLSTPRVSAIRAAETTRLQGQHQLHAVQQRGSRAGPRCF